MSLPLVSGSLQTSAYWILSPPATPLSPFPDVKGQTVSMPLEPPVLRLAEVKGEGREGGGGGRSEFVEIRKRGEVD